MGVADSCACLFLARLLQAGVRSSKHNGTTAECLQPPATGEQSTPEHQRRFQSTYLRSPGVPSRNHVAAGDPPPRPASFAYGVRSSFGESAGSLLNQPARNTALVEVQDEYDARTFRGLPSRPLGRSSAVARGAHLPERFADPEHRFGCTTDKSVSAKDLLQPYDTTVEADPAVAEQYKRSHHAYSPGEQVKRNFVMHVDPAEHRFGFKPKVGTESVASVLAWHNDALGETHHAVIVPEHMERLHQRTQPPIGVSKSVALVREGAVPDRVFGKISRNDDVSVGMLVHNSLPEELQRPDVDLGRSRTRGTLQADVGPRVADRVFGVPSVRSDIRAPRVRSLDDRQNYGAEKGAWELVNPSPYHHIGVSETDFVQPLEKEALRAILSRSGVLQDEAEFERIYEQAAAIDARGLVSIESFRKVRERLIAATETARIERDLTRTRARSSRR